MNITPKYLALVIATFAGQVSAAGFALNEQSVKSMGTGQAGRESMAADASTVYTNPAGMTALSGTQLSGALSYIYAPATIDNVQGFPTGTNDGDMIPPQEVGASFATHQLNEQLTIGIGMYAPFGLSTNYEKSFQGRYFGDKSKVKVISLQPAIAYKISPDVSLGLGVSINHLEGLLSADITTLAPNSHLEVTGDDIAMGYNIGVLWQVQPDTKVGLTYRGKTSYTLDGKTEITNAPASLIPAQNATYDASLAISTPATFSTSVSHRLNKQVTLHGEASLTKWSVLKELVIENSGASYPFDSIHEPLDWKDAWLYSVGAEYQLQDNIVLRSGIGIDKTPVTDAHRGVRIPSEDRTFLALGGSYQLNQQMSMDVAYMYLTEKTAHVDISKPTTPESYSADFHGKAHIVSVQMNLKF